MNKLNPVYNHEGTWATTTVCQSNASKLECFVLVTPVGVTLPAEILKCAVLLLNGEDEVDLPCCTLTRYEDDVLYGMTLRNCMYVRVNASFKFDPDTGELIEFSYTTPECPKVWNILNIEDYNPAGYSRVQRVYDAIMCMAPDVRKKFFEFANEYGSEVFFMLQRKRWDLPLDINTVWKEDVYVPEFKDKLQEILDFITALDHMTAVNLYTCWNELSKEFWIIYPRLLNATDAQCTNLFN